MRSVLDIQKQLLPDLIQTLKKRHAILQRIMFDGPIGRRMLASALGMTERVLRAEVDFLKGQGLIVYDSQGMRLSEAGLQLMEQLKPIIGQLFGLADLEERIQKRFGVIRTVVVPGDSDESSLVKKEMGWVAANELCKLASPRDVIAVTGGSTLAEVANQLTACPQLKGSLFVPARGGLGERVELQANTIASRMAAKVDGQYRLLHVSDQLSEEAYQSLIQEPAIKEMIELIRKARIVVHGIGDAIVMAKRRRLDEKTVNDLQRNGAVGEALGYYFDHKGNIVHKMTHVGLRLEDMKEKTVIAVAGGKSKAKAIAAVLFAGFKGILITDEAAAEQMISLFDDQGES